ncbi:MAG: hypothetical protein ACK595_05635, partial [Planctomycetota bacterium]
MTNAVWMERLCALVPSPRKHVVTYHGVLAPASGLRPKVVSRQTAVGDEEGQALPLAAATVRAVVGKARLRVRTTRRRQRRQRLPPYVASTRKAVPAPERVCGCHTAVAVAAVAG